ncbi:MAG TPA: precorrin-6Y C5,15-methyltransferase (decarboxylating) subunit CbiT, partial [Candidatus Sulfotelmatobacter sp.]|nr:precorrin-6Y C5,15-methyltransferase (decarboxylating) subunit CbiT [Candidatus Sulfotelmatobacter sp.]
AMLPEDRRERLAWTAPLGLLLDEVLRRRGRRVCVLATGDPLWHGIGVALAKRVPAEEMTILPAPSAYSLAAARLGWPLAEVDAITLHGRPLDLLSAFLQPGRRILALSENGATPGRAAALLARRGYGASRLTVLARMGGRDERIVRGIAADWAAADIDDLNTIAIECVADAGTMLLARVPGLPDAAFRHDGQLTKREVRAVTLAALAPLPGQRLWDVGAGAGSVAIEWLRAHRDCRAVAVERRRDRLDIIAENAAALGVPQLEIVAGTAPAALAGLAAPDAIFIGGGAGTAGLFEACWQALKPQGRLVANAVTLEGEQALQRWRAEVGGALVRLAVERAAVIGGFTAWHPLRPIVQLQATRP